MKPPRLVRILLCWLAVLFSASYAAAGLGLPATIVTNTPDSPASFPLVAAGAAAPLWHDAADHAGVVRAIGDLQADIERVTGVRPTLSSAALAVPPTARPVILGTIGHSALIDALIASGKLDVSDLAGKWESFVITVVSQPLPGVDQALVIVGSDKRGTIYGIYELSEQLGVSPWYWWADVPPKTRAAAYVVPGRHVSGEPVVKYRGIFLNDEAPALTGWTNAKFGGRNHLFYAKVFELLLRLRGNYLWPAMWGDAFNEDDSESPRLADEYGIVMGTSHHEPMLRAQQEWSRHKVSYGNAQWDYTTNGAGLRQFWRDGIARNKNYESIVTVGMRGDGDAPMVVGGDIAANASLLQSIITDQRQILATETGRPASAVPQLWALYKEVQDYYDYGLRPPDDVTLLWCDDNWGNIRRLPATGDERARPGGSGVYYHFDYVGGPRSYKWLNTNPLPKVQEQMNLAWQNGATRVWIVNVGDLKPMEAPIEFFLRMAWDPARWPAESCDEFLRLWAARDFGAAYANEAAALVARYTKLNGRRKPELLEPATFSLLNYREADRALAEWRDLADRARALHAALPLSARDAFYQLVLHPILACSNLNELYVAAARNALHAAQSRASTNTTADRVRALFQYDADLTTAWNSSLAGGKWIHLMDQIHIGYTSWNEPSANTLPTLASYSAPATADLGVALEGSTAALTPGAIGVLPLLHSENGTASRYLDLFRRGTLSTSYSIVANQPWVTISPASGVLGDDVRAEIGIDWNRAPTGVGEVLLSVQGATAASLRTVRLPFVKTVPAPLTQPLGFLDPEGFVAIEAPHYDRAITAGGASWKTLPDHGRSVGGVTPFPVTAASVPAPGGASPRLEYDVYLRRQGELTVRLVVSPTMNYVPGRALRCAISLDDQTPQTIAVGADYESAAWTSSVKDSVRTVSAAVISDHVGSHVFKFWMVDPGIVLQRVEIDTGSLKPSYLGPPESPRGRRAAAAISGAGTSGSVSIEAESGALGTEMPAFSATVPAYVSVSTNGSGSSPATAARTARYQITFPAAGAYRLFARVRVGSGAANDDSLFLGNGFGVKSPALTSDWKTINNLSGIGYVNASDIVASSNSGTAGTGVWKWLDLSALAGLTFTVPTGALIQTLDLGGREDGLDIDKLVFGPAANTFSVDDLMQGASGTAPAPAVRVLEAEASLRGADLVLTSGSPAYLTVSTANSATPGSSARVMRFTVGFAASGSYRLFARVRVGSGGASDDSLFVGAGFGAKDPALASDWKTANNFSGTGYVVSTDVVPTSNGGSAGTSVWKWIDLSAVAGANFSVPAGSFSQTFDLGGREDGLDIDKVVFAPSGNAYTVADLDSGASGTALSVAPVITLALDEPRQTIDGFGASSAWTAAALSDAQADLFFSAQTGLGLSLLRVRIAPAGNTSELVTAQKAVARGARVWATPWSPPAEWKSNADVNNGGTLLPEFSDGWAARLADFAVTMRSAGVSLAALSAQNEPNYTATWESCRWTPTELSAFVRDHLGPALAARGLSTRVLAPESINSDALAGYGDALLGDAAARPYVSHLATHSYGRTPVAYPAAAAAGLRYWQTEFTDDAADTDPSIDSGLRVAAAIHDFLAVAEGNAWHYWWLLPNGTNAFSTSGLIEGGVPAKRAWALGNWARFVRPGHQRVRTYGSDDAVRASAFVSPTSRRLTLVVVNLDAADRVVPLAFSGGLVPSLTPWETSASRSLASLSVLSPAADGSFALPLPARSVTTFVSESLNRPPASLSLSAASIRENLPAGTFAGRLSATDPDPGDSFTYALVSGAGDADNAAFTVVGDELRSAVPLDHEASATRSVRIRTIDTQGVAFERTFSLTVLDAPFEYADWAAALPALRQAPDQDPDGDGVVNLLAYAFGTSPGQTPSTARLPRLFVDAQTLYFGFSLPAVPSEDTVYQIERSNDLLAWTVIATKEPGASWTGAATVDSSPSQDGGIMVRVVVVSGAGRVFHRLRVSLWP